MQIVGLPSATAMDEYLLANPETVLGGVIFKEQLDPVSNKLLKMDFTLQFNSTVSATVPGGSALCPIPELHHSSVFSSRSVMSPTLIPAQVFQGQRSGPQQVLHPSDSDGGRA